MATDNCNKTTTHIDECEHAFIKNGHAENILVFVESDHGSELLDRIKAEGGYDEVVCLCEYGSKVTLHSSWDGKTFTPPTLDHLYKLGISNENQAMHDARVAELEKQATEPTPVATA